jgi:hypothetical protein
MGRFDAAGEDPFSAGGGQAPAEYGFSGQMDHGRTFAKRLDRQLHAIPKAKLD